MTLIRLTALLIVAAFPLQMSWASGPSISFDKETHDYGRVVYGDIVRESFNLTNKGNQTLMIEKLDASCGCTRAVKGASEVPPKGSSTIEAEFDTNGLRPGRKEKSIFVHSNDPDRPVVKLTLFADVIRDLNIAPPSLAKQLPAFVESISFPMKVTNSSDKPWSIKGIRSKADGLQASLSNTTPITVGPHGSSSFAIVVNLIKEPDRYYYMGRLLVETDHPRESEIEIRYLIRLGKGE